MRYLAPATDVQDALDLVTIPSLGKAETAPREVAARVTHSSRKAAGRRFGCWRQGAGTR